MDNKFIDKLLKAKKGKLKDNEIMASFKLAIQNPRTIDDIKTIVKVSNKVIKLLEDEKPSSKKD